MMGSGPKRIICSLIAVAQIALQFSFVYGQANPAMPMSVPIPSVEKYLDQANGKTVDQLVAQALARLPEDYQTVIVLRHMEGLTFPQVAERMGRSVDSVEKLWLRGLTKLRKEFSAEFP